MFSAGTEDPHRVSTLLNITDYTLNLISIYTLKLELLLFAVGRLAPADLNRGSRV